MRSAALAAGLLALAVVFQASVPAASAQTSVELLVTTPDPAAYSQQVAERLTTDGVVALRPLLTQLYAAQVRAPATNLPLPPQLEAQFSTMQGYIAGRRASFVRKLDDITVADTIRSIYYYHYYGDNVWVFTRFDFLRVADNRWAVSLVLWGGDPSMVGFSAR